MNGTQGPPPMNGTQGPMGPRPIPKVYGENITIPYNSNLGCGACIRGGYVYCIPGAEGSDPATWAAGNKAFCCQSKTNCSYISNTKYNCSSKYTDTMLAKSLCPFRKNSCGNNTAFGFDSQGQQQSVNISLAQGETCTFQIQADCGLPTFKPNDTTGFDIETIDYDADDLVTTPTNTSKAQQIPPNNTNATKPPGPPPNGTNGSQGPPPNGTGQPGQQGPPNG